LGVEPQIFLGDVRWASLLAKTRHVRTALEMGHAVHARVVTKVTAANPRDNRRRLVVLDDMAAPNRPLNGDFRAGDGHDFLNGSCCDECFSDSAWGVKFFACFFIDEMHGRFLLVLAVSPPNVTGRC